MAKYDWTTCPFCGKGQLRCRSKLYDCDECKRRVTGQAIFDKLAENAAAAKDTWDDLKLEEASRGD
jgi:ribosomal protein L37AE/L43A